MKRDKQVKIHGLIKIKKYWCSTKGEVFGPRGKALKPSVNNQGYPLVTVLKGRERITVAVHQIVYLYHYGPYGEDLQINHLNGDKRDNRIWNLAAVTASENQKHSFSIGLASQRGEKNGNSKLNNFDVECIREYWKNGYSAWELAKAYRVSKSLIYLIANRKVWKCVS